LGLTREQDQTSAPTSDDDEKVIDEILKELPGPAYFGKYRMNVVDFEKVLCFTSYFIGLYLCLCLCLCL
jgi:hypothetical protein